MQKSSSPFSWELQADRRFAKRSNTRFALGQPIYLSNFCLPIAFNFIFSQSSSNRRWSMAYTTSGPDSVRCDRWIRPVNKLVIWRTSQRLDSIYVTTFFNLLKMTDSVPQTFTHGVTTEEQTFQQNTAVSFLHSESRYRDKNCIRDVTFIRSISVLHAETAVRTLFLSSRSYPQTLDLRFWRTWSWPRYANELSKRCACVLPWYFYSLVTRFCISRLSQSLLFLYLMMASTSLARTSALM